MDSDGADKNRTICGCAMRLYLTCLYLPKKVL